MPDALQGCRGESPFEWKGCFVPGKKIKVWWLLAALVVVLILSVTGVATAMPAEDGAKTLKSARVDYRPDPLSQKQFSLKQTAMDYKFHGKIKGDVVEISDGEWVNLANEGTARVWTLLTDFTDLFHNTSTEPDRTVDNTTIWENFDKAYYEDILYNTTPGAVSMYNYFKEQSSGKFLVDGDVTDWTQLPYGYKHYDDGSGDVDTSANVWLLLQDGLDQWYQDQIDDGKTTAEINAYLATFDVYDRYDFDGDHIYNEPDGYIDHFQAVHAGDGEEGNGGPDAIWSHSWYAYYANIGKTGPAFNEMGGVQIGDSDFWVGKYTIQPEMGGLGVFAHEFTHDLGIPDLYDYNYRENDTGFWTLMSSGSWLSDGTHDLGSKPNGLGAWEKLMLGWINTDDGTAAFIGAGDTAQYVLGPSSHASTGKQAVVVVLPDKTVNEYIGAPYAGTKFFFSGSADNLNNKMYKEFTLPAGSPQLSAMVNYGIEVGYDYATVVVSTDGGTTWTAIPSNLTNSSVETTGGIDGFSSGWVPLTADLSAYAGQTLLVGFQYVTDGGVSEKGFLADDVTVGDSPVDGAETDTGWTMRGFRITSGSETKDYHHYYIAENKTYTGFDSVLQVGPYNFGFLNNPALGNWVEHFSLQDGMLISYYDTQYPDNNTNLSRPGTGMLLYVDAHPQALKRPDGKPWRSRVQSYDATFSIAPTDPITLHIFSKVSKIQSLAGVREFNDLKTYYDSKAPWNSVKVPHTGTKISITGSSKSGLYLQILVSVPKNPAQ